MRQVTATEKYRAVNEGKMAKGEFVRQMRLAYPTAISQWSSFNDTVQILKNKGFISEKTEADTSNSKSDLNISISSIERGVRYELQGQGIDPTHALAHRDEELLSRVEAKVIKNLKKDPLYYIHLLSKESSSVDKNDKMKEVKKGEEKDVFNGMKKAELKEEAKGIVKEALNKDIKAFGSDLGKRLQQAGFEVKYLDGRISDEQRNYINTNTGFVALEPYQNESLQSLFVYFNPKELSKIQAVVGKFQTSDYSGRPIERGWTAKQVQGAINPGDIYKGTEANGRIDFHRLAQVNTSVKNLKEIDIEGHDIKLSSEKQNIITVAREIRAKYGDIPGFNKLLKDYLYFHMDDIKSGDVTNPIADFDNYIDANYDRLDEQPVNEMQVNYNQVFEAIYDLAEQTELTPREQAADVMEAIGQEFEIDFEFGAGPSRMEEKKASKDYDKDGKIEDEEEEYKGVKDRAIKSAMGKSDELKEAVKSIIKKVLTQEMISEAATARLSQYGEEYSDFEGVKQIVNQLENIVTEVESFYDRINNKVKDIFEKVGEVRNEEGLKVGGFIAPSIEAAFRNDLKPVQKTFLVGIELPKVKTISQADIDRVNAGGELEEEPKQNVFAPVYESKKK